MEKNLRDLYAEKYLNTAPSGQTAPAVIEEGSDEKKTFKKGAKKGASAKGRTTKYQDGSFSDEEIGGKFYDSTSFDDIFGGILKTLNEEFGADVGGDDSTFDFDSEGGEGGGEDEQISVSRSAISAIIEQLQALIGEGGDEYEEEGDDGAFGGAGEGDEIPTESYGPDGAGSNHGAQGDYSGKAGQLPATDLVEPNGNAKFGKMKVGGKPTKTTGSLGANHGAQGNYNGKAGKLPATNLVKGNGDAEFGKNKTGYGKGKGEDLY